MTGEWLVTDMDLLPLERITWVYQKEAGNGLLEFGLAASGVLSKRQAELARGVNAARTTSLTAQAIGNPPVTISVLSLHLETFLVALLDRAPGVVLGYHEEYEKLWLADEEGFVKSTELFLNSSEALEVVTDATDAISDLGSELDPYGVLWSSAGKESSQNSPTKSISASSS